MSGSSVVLNLRSKITGSTGSEVILKSGLAIDSGAVYVNAGKGLELTNDNDNLVGVKLSATAGRKNIDNTDGTYVSLNRAFEITTSSAYLDDNNHNPTLGQILASLGANMMPAS